MKESDAPQSQGNTADHSNNPKNRGAVGNLPPSVGGGPPSPAEHNNPNGDSGHPPWWRRLAVWTFIGEIVLVVITIRIACIYSDQLDQMRESVKIAHDTFVAANKPSVGVNGISPMYGTKTDGGEAFSSLRTKKTDNLGFRVDVKNFGSVAATNFTAKWIVFLDGVPGKGIGPESGTVVLFPQKSIFFQGYIGSENYQAVVVSATKTLELEVTVSYDGPGPNQNYTYCEKDRFSPTMNAFTNLGAACTGR
jgi:hypothetical protein